MSPRPNIYRLPRCVWVDEQGRRLLEARFGLRAREIDMRFNAYAFYVDATQFNEVLRALTLDHARCMRTPCLKGDR